MNILARVVRQFKGETLTLGLDIGSRGIKAVLMRHHSNGKMSVDRAAYAPIRAGVIREGQIVAADSADEADDQLDSVSPKEWIRRALAEVVSEIGFSPVEMDICVSPPWLGGLLVDRITLPEKSDIFMEAQKRPPFDGSDIVLDYQILGHVGEDKQRQVNVLLAAARNPVVLEWGALFRNAEMEPMAFDADIFALYNAWLLLKSTEPLPLTAEADKKKATEEGDDDGTENPKEVIALLSVGMQRVVVTFVVDGNFQSSRDVTGASLTAFQRTLARRANLDKTVDVESMLRSDENWPQNDEFFKIAYRQAATDLGTGVQQAIRYFHSAHLGLPIDKVLICGGGALVPALPDMLAKKLELPVEIFDPLNSYGFKYRKKSSVQADISPLMATAFGLATRKF